MTVSPEDPAGKPMKRVAPRSYVVALLCGLVAGFATLGAVYGGLYLVGRLPPPALSNSVCVDMKLDFMRDHPVTDPNFLVVGSSVAWRNFDSSVVARDVPGARPLNGGFCGMHIHRAAFTANWLIQQFPSIERVVLIASPLDYRKCEGSGQAFDPVDASGYVFERRQKWLYYLRYFDPISLVRNIALQARDRAEAEAMGFTIEFTDYGDGPMDTQKDRGVFYGAMDQPEVECLDALRALATKLKQQNRRFVVITTPLDPEWKVLYDPTGASSAELTRRITIALEGTNAELWDANQLDLFDSSAFFDAVHIRWSEADSWTKAILQRLAL